MIEALVCSVIWSTGFLFLIKTGLLIVTRTLADDWTEELLLNPISEQQVLLQNNMKRLGFTEVIVDYASKHVRLNASSALFTIDIEKNLNDEFQK